MTGADTMARPKARPKGPLKGKPEAQAERITIISLKGTSAQADWLEEAHRKTHIAKSVIVRLALDLWGKERGLPPFPVAGDDE